MRCSGPGSGFDHTEHGFRTYGTRVLNLRPFSCPSPLPGNSPTVADEDAPLISRAAVKAHIDREVWGTA